MQTVTMYISKLYVQMNSHLAYTLDTTMTLNMMQRYILILERADFKRRHTVYIPMQTVASARNTST